MTEKETKCCCCNRKKERSEKEYKDLINRLSRIEGQIRGIKRMLDEDCYCPDIITCLLYTSPSPRDRQKSRMPSSA